MNRLNKLIEPALLVLAVLLILLTTTISIAPRFGWMLSDIGSGSMSPTLKVGTLVIARKIDPASLKAGDIIIFRYESMVQNYVCHRIVQVQGSNPVSFRTKGDNSPQWDSNPVMAEDVVGKVIYHIGLLGHFIQFLKSAIGLLLGLIVPAAVLIVICSRLLLREIKKLKPGTK